jgi:hypothetical protein
MRAPRASLLGILLALFLAPELARAANYGELGTLERGAVDAALAARELVLDPAPEGKTVGFIHVVNLDVFQPSDGGLLEWFNHFHRTSREHHVRRESLLLPGMAYDPKLADETTRNLRNRSTYSAKDPTWSGVVAMVPVQAATPGTVDLLIVTRDVWSLRFNSDYNYQPGYLINLSTSLSENNLFGWRKQAAVAFIMNQGDLWLGPTYLDPNVLGTRLRLTAAFYEIWARKIGEIAAGPHEGFSDWQRLEYPFYALSQRWGGFVDGSYTTNVARSISGSSTTQPAVLRRFDPNLGQCVTPGGPSDPNSTLTAECAYRSRVGGFTSGLTRSFPRSWLVQRVTVGNEIGLVRPSLLPDFSTDPNLRDGFARTYFRISERTSGLYAQYDAFTPRYRTYRDLDTYDLAEDNRLGPSVTLRFGRASTWLGSDADFFRLKAEAHVNAQLLGGFQSIGASWESRDYSDGLRDQLIKAQFYAATPVLGRSLRIVASGVAGFVADNVHRGRVYVGGLEGLRGYPVNTFFGYDWYLAHLELRSMSLSLASLRVGGLVFADAGHAADTAQGLMLYSDVGAGLRLLIPQLNVEVLRCDWGFPFRSYGPVQAGWPGRISCGFRQVF